jgi:hypothetical protein
METGIGLLGALIMLVLTIEVTNTLTVGSIIVGILVSIGTLLSIIFGIRYKVAFETERAAREATKVNAEETGKRADRLEGALLDARHTIAALEKRPDYERVLTIFQETAQSHETRAQDRHEHLITALEAITRRIET